MTGWVGRAAGRTHGGTRRGALPTELQAGRVLVLGRGTWHARPSERGRGRNGRTGGESLGWPLRRRQAPGAAGQFGAERDQVESTCPYCVSLHRVRGTAAPVPAIRG